MEATRTGERASGGGREAGGIPAFAVGSPCTGGATDALTRVKKSMILRASLTKETGGYEWCRPEGGQPAAAFRNTNDPDYQAILQAIRAAKVRQEEYGRRDIRGFRPGDYYVRWMKRFGVLPESFDLATDRIDPYETDQAYWRSLWYQPPAVRTASAAGHDR